MEKTGLHTRLVSEPHKPGPQQQVNPVVKLNVNSHRLRYIAQRKFSFDRKSMIYELNRALSDLSEQVLLVTWYVRQEIAEFCR